MTNYGLWLTKCREHAEWAPEQQRIQFFALGLAGEAGELANLAKKEWRSGQVMHVQRSAMRSEAVDVIGYAVMLLLTLGCDDPIAESLEKLLEVEQRPEWLAFKAAHDKRLNDNE